MVRSLGECFQAYLGDIPGNRVDIYRVPVAAGQPSHAQDSAPAGPNIGYYPIRASLSQFSSYLKGTIFSASLCPLL